VDGFSDAKQRMLDATYYGDQEVILCENEVGIVFPDEESVVLSGESDADYGENHNDDGLNEEVYYDSDVEMMAHEDEMLPVYNGELNAGEQLERCRNCSRKKNAMIEFTDPYCLDLALYECTGVQTHLKFSILKVSDMIDETHTIALCCECASFLVLAEKQTMNNVWPTFMWNVLSNEVIRGHFGVQVWSYIPMKWRHWWIDDFMRLHGGNEAISMESPKAIFDELSDSRMELMKSLKELKLGELMKSVNKHLFPTILCPWGCSEFPHKIELLPMDIVFLRYLGPGVAMVTRGTTTATQMKGSRDDYVNVEKEIYLLMNPAWRVMPSIVFDIDKGPSVIVCQNHKGGSRLDYIHVPVHPRTTLPAKFLDQLSPAVMQSRVIHSMRVKNYSISFQMHEMRGSFAGLDTLSLGSNRRFDFRSLITMENEAIALCCRKDVCGLVMRLLQSGKIPEFLVENMMDAARNMFDNVIFCARRFGGVTYMSYGDAIKLKKLRCGRKELTVHKIDERSGIEAEVEIQFYPLWPPYLVVFTTIQSLEENFLLFLLC
jgi:hypothetical protein